MPSGMHSMAHTIVYSKGRQANRVSSPYEKPGMKTRPGRKGRSTIVPELRYTHIATDVYDGAGISHIIECHRQH